MIDSRDRKRRTHARRTPSAPRHPLARPLVEPVEPRLLLCVDHLDGFNLTFWGSGDALAGPVVKADAATAGSAGTTTVGPTVTAPPRTAPAFAPVTWTTTANGTPILNSLTSAPTAVYLDFDGNGSEVGYNETGSDPATFDAAEQAVIAEAWRHVSAYFAMFNTNVTTVPTSLPRVWNLIGNNINNGYAYVNTFPNSSPQAFNNSGHGKSRQSGLAHEIGHVFGLQHQSAFDLLGNRTAEYLSAPDPLHGAIMGVDYSGNVHKWFVGHSTVSPGTLQDDVAVIANKIKAREPVGGDGFRPDDFGNTIAAAAALADDGGGLQYASGIIERMTDLDVFSFTAADGGVALAAVPELPSGLDARLEVFDADGRRLAATDGANNYQELSLSLPAGTYYATVSSHGDYGDLGKYDLSVRPLPAGWSSVDVGATGVTGYTHFDSATNTFTNAGAGPDMTGTTDQFHFAHQALRGDGEIVARITQNENTGGNARAGLEIRESLAENSRHAALVLNSGGGAQMIYRTTTGGSAVSSTLVAGLIPRWVRLVRAANVVTGYASPDGVTWTQIGPQVTLATGATAYIGLATTAGNTGRLNAAKFDSVAVTTNPPPARNALPAPANLTVNPAPTGTGFSLTWDDVPGATGFAVERSTDGASWTPAGLVAGATSYTDNAPTTWMRYFYRVSARDEAAANSAPSETASAVNRPGAPTNVSVTEWTTTSLVINWKDVSGDAGYRVERSVDGGATFTPLATVPANYPSYTNSGLTAGTTYRYRVVTLSPAGDSAPSATALGGTRIAAVTGTAIDSVTPTSVTLRWTDMAIETGYRIERSTNAGTSWTTVTDVAANVTTFTDTGRAALTEYHYRVFGLAGDSISVNPTPVYTATPATTPLPNPWAAADLGTVYGGGSRGATGYGNGTFTILAGGNDIWGTADSFRYTYQPLVGDGEITARVASIEDTDPSAKVGLMIRSSLAANSANVFATLTRNSGVHLQARATAGGSTTSASTAGIAAPYWLKLKREATATAGVYALTGYRSSDGVTWTQLGTTQNLTMPANAFIGIAATSHDTTMLMTGTVNSVTVTNAPPTVASPAVAANNPLTDSDQTTLSVLGADDHGEANLTYAWSTTAAPAGAAPPVFGNNNSNAAKSTLVTVSRAGEYQFTVTITDAGGLSVTSTVSVTVAASAFPAATAVDFDYRRTLTFTFNTDVSTGLSADDLRVEPQPSGAGAALVPDAVVWDAAANAATFTFDAPLPDGNYRATLAAAGFGTPAGRRVSSDIVYDLYVLAGDADRDRTVNFNDLLALAKNYNGANKTWADGDFNGDGAVDFTDLLALAKNYNKSVPQFAEPGTAAAAAPALAPATLAATATAPAKAPKDRADKLAGLFNTKTPVRPTPPPKPAKPVAVKRFR